MIIHHPRKKSENSIPQNEHEIVIYGDLMGFNGDLWWFNGDLMVIYGDLMGFNGDLWWFNGIQWDLMVI